MADLTILDTARAAHGDPLPDWIETLALECQSKSQSQVAKALDVSPAAISQVLRGKYAGSTARMEERVRGVYLDGKVACPALGELPVNECLKHRDRAKIFEMASPRRALMYRACNRCPRMSPQPEGATDDAAV